MLFQNSVHMHHTVMQDNKINIFRTPGNTKHISLISNKCAKKKNILKLLGFVEYCTMILSTIFAYSRLGSY